MSKQGEAKAQFKSRTELFIGPRHHTLMGDTYAVRSDVEHLHENKHLVFDRNARLDLVKKLEIMEYIARSALVRILLDRSLWPHFANTTVLQAFWALGESEWRKLWGDFIDPNDALADFDPRYISDGQLTAALVARGHPHAQSTRRAAMEKWLDIAAAVLAVAAAVFWFLSACGKLPPMVSYWDRAPGTDPLYMALKFSALMNTWAAALTGASALAMALKIFLR